MRGLAKLIWVEGKLLLREPMAAFFTLAFPLLLLLLFGSIYGNEPSEFLDGYGSVDSSVPGYTAMIIATTAFFSLSVGISAYRERGVLRRLRATPLKPMAILVSQAVVLFAMTVVGMAILVIAGRTIYGLHLPAAPLNVVAAFVLGFVSMLALGFILAGVAPTARVGQAIALVVFYPMIFLSGAGLPLQMLPPDLRRLVVVLPLTHVSNLLRGLWFGDTWGQHLTEVAVLLGLTVVCGAIAMRTFRWQ